jgi:hypothetical protein
LNVIVGIDNYRKAFPLAYCYIINELGVFFKWIADLLANLVFYDYLEAAIRDFPKGLGATLVAKVVLDLRLLKNEEEARVCLADKDPKLPGARGIIIGGEYL